MNTLFEGVKYQIQVFWEYIFMERVVAGAKEVWREEAQVRKANQVLLTKEKEGVRKRRRD